MFYDDIMLLAPEERERIHPLLSALDDADAAVYDITDVARWGREHIRGADALRYGKDLPNVAPLAPVVWMEFNRVDIPDTDFLGGGVGTFGIIVLGYDRRDEPDEVARWLRIASHDQDDMVRWWLTMGVVWRFADDGEISSIPHFMGFAVWPDGHTDGLHSALDREGAEPMSQNMRNIV